MTMPRSGLKGHALDAGGTTGTSARILKALQEGKDVRIHALLPDSKAEYGGLEVDLVRGLEYPLIQAFPSVWNRAGSVREQWPRELCGCRTYQRPPPA